MFKTLQEARDRLAREFPDVTVSISERCYRHVHSTGTVNSETDFRANVHLRGGLVAVEADTPDRAVEDIIDEINGGSSDHAMQKMLAEVKAVSDERNAEA
jgi:hypothetical protein